MRVLPLVAALGFLAGCGGATGTRAPATAVETVAPGSARWAGGAAPLGSTLPPAAPVAPPADRFRAANAQGDEIVVDGRGWSLRTSVFDGRPLTVRVEGVARDPGQVGPGERVLLAAVGTPLGAPRALRIERDGVAVQTLSRGARKPDALDLDSLGDLEPLGVAMHPVRVKGRLDLGDVEIEDLDFDGHPDLSVKASSGHKCAVVQRFLWDPRVGAFREAEVLRELPCVSTVPEKRELVSTSWTCCERFFSVFRWERGALTFDRSAVVSMGFDPKTGKPLPEGKVYVVRARRGVTLEDRVTTWDAFTP